jgi:tetratricopeptide (TPR) repeat protein
VKPRRVLIQLATLGGAVALFFTAGVVFHQTPAPVTGAAPVVVSRTGDAQGGSVEDLVERTSQLPGDWTAWAALGSAYVEEARVTGDTSHYARSEAALTRSLQLRRDDNDAALTGLATLEAARHRFGLALQHADAALALNPYSAIAHGIRSDALVQLGRYEEGIAAAVRMLELRPSAPAYARVSYAAELHGNVAGAVEAMELSRAAATTAPQRAFASLSLADLAWHIGDLATAEREYLAALEEDPANTAAMFGLGRVAAARGDTDAALTRYAEAVDLVPHPEQLMEYGQLLELRGRPDQAQDQYALARATLAQLVTDGFAPEAEGVLFEVEHGDPATAVQRAEELYALRVNVHTEDAYGWALHRAGRSEEALPHARAAVRLGSPYAPLYYHLGVVEAAAGNTAEARAALHRALALNPYFSPLHAPRADELLASLGGRP